MRVRSEITTSLIVTQFLSADVSVWVIVNDFLGLTYSESSIVNANEMKVHRESFFQWWSIEVEIKNDKLLVDREKNSF